MAPVVQSVVSLKSSLKVISLTVLVDSIHNILIFFAEKMLITFFQQKISAYLRITQNFNELLTNDVVSFEQLGQNVSSFSIISLLLYFQFLCFRVNSYFIKLILYFIMSCLFLMSSLIFPC